MEDRRPVMDQRCACGQKREVPAWSRTWQPQPVWRLAPVDPGSLLGGRLMLHRTDEPASMSEVIKLDVWSDIACPWCYIGKRNLEQAIRVVRTDAGNPSVQVEFHSFQLSPDTPVDFEGSATDYLAQHKGISREQAAAMQEHVTAVAAAAGLDYHLERVRHTNTVKAHQMLHYARSRGLQSEMKERLMRAYFTEGRHLGRDEELAALADEVGLDAEDVRRSLRDEEFLAAVRQDEGLAAAYGIRGVPFFVIDRRYALQGAQPPEAFEEALRVVAKERAAEAVR
jgi:predicted DsbA family dithiol-disulfide isomerase